MSTCRPSVSEYSLPLLLIVPRRGGVGGVSVAEGRRGAVRRGGGGSVAME